MPAEEGAASKGEFPLRPHTLNNDSVLPPERRNHLEKRILAYALGLAGVAAVSSPANASIVFTKTNISITDGTIPMDLNSDGVVDFLIRDVLVGSSSLYYQKLTVIGAVGAKVIGQKIFNQPSAWAAPLNWSIGSNSSKGFVDVNGQAGAFMADSFCSFSCFPKGPWKNKTNRFLGLEFNINGEVHYGWARLTVKNGSRNITVTLTGYAYETTPNKSILAGDKGPTEETRKMESGPTGPTLGLLSFGASALPVWRRSTVRACRGN